MHPELAPQIVSAYVALSENHVFCTTSVFCLFVPQVLYDGPSGLLPVGESSLPLCRPGLARLLDHHHPPDDDGDDVGDVGDDGDDDGLARLLDHHHPPDQGARLVIVRIS